MKTFANFTVLGIIGNIERVDFENGSLLKLKIAVNKSYLKEEEKITETHWLEAVVYGEKRVEYIEKNFTKGNRVLISGQITTQVYNRTKTKKAKKTLFEINEITQTSLDKKEAS